MLTKEHVSSQLQKYKDEHNLSLEKMAERLGIPKSSLYEYIKGRENLRSDTIDLIACKIGIILPEMFSEPSHMHHSLLEPAQRNLTLDHAGNRGRADPSGSGRFHHRQHHLRGYKKNEIKPWLVKEWCIPKADVDFVAKMEDVLEVYQRP